MSAIFEQLADEAMACTPAVDPGEAWRLLLARPDALLLDARDRQRIAQTGTAAGATPLDGDALPVDNPWDEPPGLRDPHGAGRARPVFTICDDGQQAALLADRLRGRGFVAAAYVAGGLAAWRAAGLPVAPPGPGGRHAAVLERNKAIARRALEEVWSAGRLEVADALYAVDCIDHSAPRGTPPGVEGVKRRIARIRAAHPALTFAVEDQLAEGDRVVTYWRLRGLHIAALGADDQDGPLAGIDTYRLDEGAIREIWSGAARADPWGEEYA